MKKLNTRTVATAVGLALAAMNLTITAPSFAVEPMSTSEVNADEHGLAMHGFDPVAYFKSGGPKKGKKQFAVKHTGGTYYFANAKNMKAFMDDPDRYLPQYGGFCAMGIALGKKLDGDPNVWKIVDDKLYLNVNKDVAKAWQRDIPGNLEKAEENWPDVKYRTPASLN
ncbi:MAG: YHS domain-containing protein [Alphaproteobacteria bacterium]|nr:YHS domain-containing protein [Alphaproteobacteria bacterium]